LGMQGVCGVATMGSPLDSLAGANVTDLREFVLVSKRCCAGDPMRRAAPPRTIASRNPAGRRRPPAPPRQAHGRQPTAQAGPATVLGGEHVDPEDLSVVLGADPVPRRGSTLTIVILGPVGNIDDLATGQGATARGPAVGRVSASMFHVKHRVMCYDPTGRNTPEVNGSVATHSRAIDEGSMTEQRVVEIWTPAPRRERSRPVSR
jgi:hypothetical protein